MRKKILYLVRFFNGLHNSLKNGEWSPDGVPTIYKTMEGMDKSDYNVDFVLSNYNLYSEEKFRNFHTINYLKGFSSAIHVLSVNSKKKSIYKKITNLIFIIRKLFFILNYIKKNRPDLVYVDRSHVIEGALIKKFLKCKVFLRVMGVGDYFINGLLNGKTFFSKLHIWSFKSNFDYVLLTQDGSDVEGFSKKFLINSENSSIIFNGVKKNKGKINYFNKIKNKYKNKIKILFVSRLEKSKNCEIFIKSILNLDKSLKTKIVAFIVGTGSQSDFLESLVKKKNGDQTIKFLGSIQHNIINDIFDISDIFISLNSIGNLSNSCLEAFNSGICSIIPTENKSNRSDIVIKKFIRNESIIRIPIGNMTQNITKVLTDLILNKSKINFYAKNIRQDSKKFLTTWNNRVDTEMSIIKTIIEN
ncbi:MAG: glycosyltransferase [Alphaproteobacteria bacterium]